MADPKMWKGFAGIPEIKSEGLKQLVDILARSEKELKFMLNNVDSSNVTTLNTNITSISSEDGETIINGPLLQMYDSAEELRLEMGYDEDTDTFIFSLKDALGNETIGLDGGGNATIEGVDATDITDTVTNFDGRNDRISTTPADPTIASDGSAIDHSANTDGSCDISFEWSFSGSGDAYDIDGFKIYARASSSSSSYNMGTTVAEEQQYIVDKDKRALILEGVAIDKYYTFGVRAYRAVDDDVDADGVLQSSIVQPSLGAEDPYRPSANVAFAGDVTGTIDGTSATTVKDYAENSVQEDTAYNTVKITSADGIVATRSDDKARTSIAGGELLIEKGDGTGTTWEDTFYVDSDGNATLAGKVLVGDDYPVEITDTAGSGIVRFYSGTTVKGWLAYLNGGTDALTMLTPDASAIQIWSLADIQLISTDEININPSGALQINGTAGWSGTFTEHTGKTVTVNKGIITDVS